MKNLLAETIKNNDVEQSLSLLSYYQLNNEQRENLNRIQKDYELAKYLKIYTLEQLEIVTKQKLISFATTVTKQKNAQTQEAVVRKTLSKNSSKPTQNITRQKNDKVADSDATIEHLRKLADSLFETKQERLAELKYREILEIDRSDFHAQDMIKRITENEKSNSGMKLILQIILYGIMGIGLFFQLIEIFLLFWD